MEEALEFDDVLIQPVPSRVSSRDDVDISVKLSDSLTLQFPLIASPMVGVVDGAFAKKLSDLGGLAIFHRFYKDRTYLYEDIDKNMSLHDNFGMSVKVGDEGFMDDLHEYNPKILLIDTANGYTQVLLDYCAYIKTYMKNHDFDNTLLMAGNVATRDGCMLLYNAGCDLIRVGIGGGSPCSTRNITGIGVPSVSMLRECSTPTVIGEEGCWVHDTNSFTIVMDGGIKNSGDFVKAIVAGAACGMAGRLFGECFEAPNEGRLYGMASRTHMENMKTEIKSIEGFDIEFDKKHSLETFMREFGYGIKSAGTYLNAKNLEEIYFNGDFIRVTNSAIKKGL